ncbi:hypothetical protein ABEY13_03545 [Bacillus velezensis]|uniref:hypothetical protein n=1 Tax=Bacillus velezensis TaxID=492670 RepID=UPI002DBB4289|nr:hypothetical protein [Bacillus velezensis]MEC3657886.1 hypothetical protein [Bacillus velezensis]MEC3687027.1 hypothetical protein [Bacillus velezensis]MEC3789720.1 hypothetical protein [Bacillus velezensis]
MKKKIIAGALAFGLIPLMGAADVSAKSLPNQDKIMKPAGHVTLRILRVSLFLAVPVRFHSTIKAALQEKSEFLLRMTAANLSNSPLIILMGIHSYPLRH